MGHLACDDFHLLFPRALIQPVRPTVPKLERYRAGGKRTVEVPPRVGVESPAWLHVARIAFENRGS